MRIRTFQELVEPGRGLPGPDLQYLDRLRGVKFNPVFIMGETRSGTTLLYRLLGMSECFNILTVYHILCYDEILWNHFESAEGAAKDRLNGYLATRGISDRRVDSVPISADLAEEYYHLFPFPLRLEQQGICPRTVDRFREVCGKLHITGRPGRPILLKNPPDYLNFLYIHTVIPDSKFVFIDRHPIDRLNSVLGFLRVALEEETPYFELLYPPLAKLRKTWGIRAIARWLVAPPKQFILRSLARKSQKRRAKIRELMPKLPADTYAFLRYEDLMREPQKTMQNVFDSLGLLPNVAVDYRQEIARRPRRWTPEVEQAKDWLCKLFCCGLDEDDYSSPHIARQAPGALANP
jgi:hypothetical protein